MSNSSPVTKGRSERTVPGSADERGAPKRGYWLALQNGPAMIAGLFLPGQANTTRCWRAYCTTAPLVFRFSVFINLYL